jgi:hypothetical protein
VNSTQLCSQRCGRATYTKHEPGNAFSTFFAPRGGCGCAEYEFQRSTQKHAQRPLIIFFAARRGVESILSLHACIIQPECQLTACMHTHPHSRSTQTARRAEQRERERQSVYWVLRSLQPPVLLLVRRINRQRLKPPLINPGSQHLISGSGTYHCSGRNSRCRNHTHFRLMRPLH